MKYIKIYSKIKEKKSGRKTTNVCFINDYIAITKFQNPDDAYKAFMAKKQMGQDCSWKRGVLQETYKGKKAKSIAKIIVAEQEKMKRDMEKDLDVTIKQEIKK